MSAWRTWAFRQKAATGPKFVLVALSCVAGRDGRAIAGQAEIARLTGQCLRTVRICLKKLEKSGLVTRLPRRKRGGRDCCAYRLGRHP